MKAQRDGPQVVSYSWFDRILRQRKENISLHF